jgi:Super-infection exclusion protein B
MAAPWYAPLFDWLKKPSPRYAAVIVLVTGLLLFLPSTVLGFFHLDGYAQTYRWLISLLFFFFLFLSLTYPAERAWKRGMKWNEDRKFEKSVGSVLLDLGTEQKAILLKYAQSGKRCLPFHMTDGSVGDLAIRGVLHRPMPAGDGAGYFAFCLTPTAAKFVLSDKFQEILLANAKNAK